MQLTRAGKQTHIHMNSNSHTLSCAADTLCPLLAARSAWSVSERTLIGQELTVNNNKQCNAYWGTRHAGTCWCYVRARCCWFFGYRRRDIWAELFFFFSLLLSMFSTATAVCALRSALFCLQRAVRLLRRQIIDRKLFIDFWLMRPMRQSIDL